MTGIFWLQNIIDWQLYLIVLQNVYLWIIVQTNSKYFIIETHLKQVQRSEIFFHLYAKYNEAKYTILYLLLSYILPLSNDPKSIEK